MKISECEKNPTLQSDLKGVTKNVVEMDVTGAKRNLKLSEYYFPIAKFRNNFWYQKKQRPKNEVNVRI